MTNVIVHNFGESQILHRSEDGYLNATAMCKAAGKLMGNYLRNAETNAFVDELSSDMRISISELIQSVKGGDNQGTWVHPKVAIHLAQWLSPKFAVQVTNWVHDWMMGKTVAVTISPAQQSALQAVVAQRAGDDADAGKRRMYMWSRFNNHFKLGSYKQLPVAQFSDALDYLITMPMQSKKPPLALTDRTMNHIWLVLNDSGQVIESVPMRDVAGLGGQVDKYFPTAAVMGRDAINETVDKVNALIYETAAKTVFMLAPLVNAASADDAATTWKKKVARSSSELGGMLDAMMTKAA